MKYGLALCGAAVVATVALTGTTNEEQRRSLAEVTPYGLKMIQANELEMGPSPPLICIVDSGIDLDHPEFDASMIDGIDNDNRFWMDPIQWDKDVTGHGTKLAGIIAAIAGNDIGIAGAGNFPLYITRGLDDEGQAYASDIKKAVEQCVDANSKIILLALGGQYDPRHQDFYDNIVNEKGIMVIAAAGNNDEDKPAFPARYESVIAVGGVEECGAPWEASAQQVEFVAPAFEVPTISVIPETPVDVETNEEISVHAFNGTGSASAYVAAAAGLLWSHYEECTNEQIRVALARTAYNWNNMADQVGEASERTYVKPEDGELGHGLPQVFDAFYVLQKWGCDLSDVEDITDVGPDVFEPLGEKKEEPPMDVEGDPDMITMTKASDNDGLSGGAIGSIVAFVLFVLLIAVFSFWFCVRDQTPQPVVTDPVKDDDDAQTIDDGEFDA